MKIAVLPWLVLLIIFFGGAYIGYLNRKSAALSQPKEEE